MNSYSSAKKCATSIFAAVLAVIFAMGMIPFPAYANSLTIANAGVDEDGEWFIPDGDGVDHISIGDKAIFNVNPYYDDTVTEVSGVKWDKARKILTVESGEYGPISFHSYNDDSVTVHFDGDVTIVPDRTHNWGIVGGRCNITLISDGCVKANNIGLLRAKDATLAQGEFETINSNEASLEITNRLTVNKNVALYLSQTRNKRSIKAKKMTNYASSLKKFNLPLPLNAKFKCKNGEWKVMNNDGDKVSLIGWNGGTTAKIQSFKKNGFTCESITICKNAFNSTKGRAVRTIAIGKGVDAIQNYAFNKTKSLASLKINNSDLNIYVDRYKQSFYKKILTDYNYVEFNSSIGKKAFAGMGKSNGKKLTVHYLDSHWKNKNSVKMNKTIRARQSEIFKKAMLKKGLSRKSAVTI